MMPMEQSKVMGIFSKAGWQAVSCIMVGAEKYTYF
jgi:hypothetical protein